MKKTFNRQRSKPRSRPEVKHIRTTARLKADMPKLQKALPKYKWPRLKQMFCELEEIDEQLIYEGYREDLIESEDVGELLRDKESQFEALARLFEGVKA